MDALVDPDENTFDPEDGDENDEEYTPSKGSKKGKCTDENDDGRKTSHEIGGTEDIATVMVFALVRW